MANQNLCAGKRGLKVLISGRDQELNRSDGTETLRFSGFNQTFAIRDKRQPRLKALGLQADSAQPDKIRIDIDPLYLFACSLLWHKRADPGAGWELVRGLKLAQPQCGSPQRCWRKPRICRCGPGSFVAGWPLRARRPRKRLQRLEGSILVIRNRTALEAMAA